MGGRISMRQKRLEAPEWIFSWKPRGEPLAPKLFAITFAASVTAALIGLTRIHTSSPDPWGLDKANIIHVPDTPEGRALALTARENGPSPVRFETSDWPDLVRFETEQLARVSWVETQYRPELRPWQEPPPALPAIWRSDTTVLPPTAPPPDPPQIPPAGQPHPVILPLSGIAESEVPSSLPRYSGPMDDTMMSGSVRFMLHLDADGLVNECIAIAGGDSIEATRELEHWLRAVKFPERNRKPGWIAVRIVFLNQAH